MNILKRGSRGEDVKALQRALSGCGYGLLVDGIYGEITEEAVRDFQAEHGLGIDGIAGPMTLEALSKEHIAGVVVEAKLGLKKSKRKINLIVVHCTATEEGKDYTVDWIRKVHKKAGYGDIGYHYVIYRDGSLHEGRSVNLIGAHARNHNAHSIGVCYVGGCPKGDTHANKDTRTEAQKATLLKVLKELRQLYPYAKIVGHKDVNATGCPSFDAKSEYKNI